MGDSENTSQNTDSPTKDDIRQLLIRFQAKDDQAASDLLQHFSRELHAIAVQHMRRERVDHTLQPTALVNEAYLRLIGLDQLDWQGRAHFLGMAARTMRRILVDHARRKNARKRGAGVTVLGLQDIDGAVDQSDNYDLVCLDEALERLQQVSERQARIVDLRFFGGLNIQETAATLRISEDIVKKEARFALAWLRSQLAP